MLNLCLTVYFSPVSCRFIFFNLDDEFGSYTFFSTGRIKILLGE